MQFRVFWSSNYTFIIIYIFINFNLKWNRGQGRSIVTVTRNFILGLEAKKYKLKNGTSGRYHYGFIAQPVKELMDKTIGDVGLIVKSEKLTSDDQNYVPIDFENEDTYYYGLRYEEFIAPMVKTIQYQQKEIEGLEKRISILEEQIQK